MKVFAILSILVFSAVNAYGLDVLMVTDSKDGHLVKDVKWDGPSDLRITQQRFVEKNAIKPVYRD